MSGTKEGISYRDVVRSVGVRVGDQVTFKLPGSDRADIGTVKSIKHDNQDNPLYEIFKGDAFIALLAPEFIE